MFWFGKKYLKSCLSAINFMEDSCNSDLGMADSGEDPGGMLQNTPQISVFCDATHLIFNFTAIFSGIRYGIHSAVITVFNPGKNPAMIKLKCVIHDKILHSLWSILQCVPGPLLPSIILTLGTELSGFE